MKNCLLVLLISLTALNLQASPVSKLNEEEISKLADGFAQALVKKDTAWLKTNLADEFTSKDPGGITLDKQGFISSLKPNYLFEEIKFKEKALSITTDTATCKSAMVLKGTASMEGGFGDISGTYPTIMHFKKSAAGWQIHSFNVMGQ